MEQHAVSMQQATAERLAVLSRIGTALMSELDDARLLRLIAETACDLTGATFTGKAYREAVPGNDGAASPLRPHSVGLSCRVHRSRTH
jgi:hypothetical protein